MEKMTKRQKMKIKQVETIFMKKHEKIAENNLDRDGLNQYKHYCIPIFDGKIIVRGFQDLLKGPNF